VVQTLEKEHLYQRFPSIAPAHRDVVSEAQGCRNRTGQIRPRALAPQGVVGAPSAAMAVPRNACGVLEDGTPE